MRIWPKCKQAESESQFLHALNKELLGANEAAAARVAAAGIWKENWGRFHPWSWRRNRKLKTNHDVSSPYTAELQASVTREINKACGITVTRNNIKETSISLLWLFLINNDPWRNYLCATLPEKENCSKKNPWSHNLKWGVRETLLHTFRWKHHQEVKLRSKKSFSANVNININITAHRSC